VAHLIALTYPAADVTVKDDILNLVKFVEKNDDSVDL
jgi:hypothetical protein